MNRFTNMIVSAVLAIWMPFCCCQVRAAVNAAVQPSAPAAGEQKCTHCCCANKTDAAQTDDAQPRDDAPAKTGGGCCTSCKDRVLPMGVTLPAPDTIGCELPYFAWPIELTALTQSAGALPVPAVDTGPPGDCGGRAILQQACVLVV